MRRSAYSSAESTSGMPQYQRKIGMVSSTRFSHSSLPILRLGAFDAKSPPKFASGALRLNCFFTSPRNRRDAPVEPLSPMVSLTERALVPLFEREPSSLTGSPRIGPGAGEFVVCELIPCVPSTLMALTLSSFTIRSVNVEKYEGGSCQVRHTRRLPTLPLLSTTSMRPQLFSGAPAFSITPMGNRRFVRNRPENGNSHSSGPDASSEQPTKDFWMKLPTKLSLPVSLFCR